LDVKKLKDGTDGQVRVAMVMSVFFERAGWKE